MSGIPYTEVGFGRTHIHLGRRQAGRGQAMLAQFGYVALKVGAMFPAAVMIVAVARLGILPAWHQTQPSASINLRLAVDEQGHGAYPTCWQWR